MSLDWVLIQYEWYPFKIREIDSHRQRRQPHEDKGTQGECYMMTETKTGVVESQAKEC